MHLALALELERAAFHNCGNSPKQEMTWISSLLLEVQWMLWYG